MNAEWALLLITIIGAIGTGFNVWISLRTSNAILGVKLWAVDKFVAKDEIIHYLRPVIRESSQLHESAQRVKHAG